MLLAALGMTLLWWWQGYQKDQENREQLVNSAPIAQITNDLPEGSNALVIEQPVQSEELLPAQEQTAEQPKTETEITTEPANVLQKAETIIDVDVAEPPVVVGNDELRIEITGSQSWVTVRNAKNKRLAEKLYSNGEVLTFNENEQYRLTIGAPANVKIYYKGEEVPLKIDGRVARIRLPLQ